MMAAQMRDIDVDRLGDLVELARRDDLGQHHGGRLEGFFLLLAVVPRGAVLHHQHADGQAAAQDRHAEEGVIDLLARLGQVLERAVRLGVRQVERLGGRGDGADQAFADPQLGGMHRLAVEALGGIELEHPAGAHDIERADLGHHVGRDQRYGPVQSGLGCLRLRHHLAQPSQQDTRA
jgi:hypothetical protein